MKQKITLLLCLAIPIFCMAQTQLAREYDYDAAGNRILRKVINLTPAPTPPASKPDVTDPTEPKYFVEKFGQVEMKIYPNPATEQITLEIAGWENLQTGILKLYSLNGQLLQEQKVNAFTTPISLSGLPKGVYILKVYLNDQTEEWKVVKN